MMAVVLSAKVLVLANEWSASGNLSARPGVLGVGRLKEKLALTRHLLLVGDRVSEGV
jgi:hypothetical protein